MVFELSAEDAAAHPNPYATVELTVTFRSPRQHSYALGAYWDGANRLVVRFSPTEVGNWDYLVTSNIATWNQQRGSFSTAPSDSKGFIHPAALHHWEYTEKANGLDQAHLWMGVSEPRFAFVDDAASHFKFKRIVAEQPEVAGPAAGGDAGRNGNHAAQGRAFGQHVKIRGASDFQRSPEASRLGGDVAEAIQDDKRQLGVIRNQQLMIDLICIH